MTWTSTQGSHLFQYTTRYLLTYAGYTNTAPGGLSATGLVGDTIKFALFTNTGTPDQTVTTALLTAYNGTSSQWVTANESSATGYTAGGNALSGTRTWAYDSGSGSICFFAGATSTAWTITAGTLTSYGGLLYDTSLTTAGNFVANQGLCFNFFGGAQTLTGSGTFTVNWATPPSGGTTAVFNITV